MEFARNSLSSGRFGTVGGKDKDDERDRGIKTLKIIADNFTENAKSPNKRKRTKNGSSKMSCPLTSPLGGGCVAAVVLFFKEK